MTDSTTSNRTLIAGVIAGLTASVCCVGPLVLLALGVSGAWIGQLTALEPFRPIFIGATLVFLGLAFRKLYLLPQTCAPSKVCAAPTHLRKQRAVFWIVSTLLVGLLAFPALVPFIFD
jgi:mercuric ion transport protein